MLSLLMSVYAMASDICVDGIYYEFDEETKSATVTYRGDISERYPNDILIDNDYSGEVVIPSSVLYERTEYKVTTIGDYAFYACDNLINVTIPKSITKIGVAVFLWSDQLTQIEVSESNVNYCSVDGVLFSKDKTVLIKYPEGKNHKSYSIPEEVTTIEDDAFNNCSKLLWVTIPESVIEIKSGAFRACDSLTNVTIPESVRIIGDEAFCRCYSLTQIEVSASNVNYCSVDGVLFDKDKIVLIQYPAKKEDKTYSIPEGVTKINDYAFCHCSGLTSITIPEEVTEIGDFTFVTCI
jgi:hypothetical protein